MLGAIKREHVDYRFFGCQNIPEIRGCPFSFRSHAMDTGLFSMMLVVQVAEQTVLGNFNCLYKDYKPWKELILATWKTIQTIEEEEKAYNERSKKIVTVPFEFISIQAVECLTCLNEHGVITIKGIVSQENAKEYQMLALDETWVTFKLIDKDGGEQIFFNGIF